MIKSKAKKVGAAAVKHVKSHRRKESLAEKLLLGPMKDEFDIKAADVCVSVLFSHTVSYALYNII